MKAPQQFDNTNPKSIYEYSRNILGRTLGEWISQASAPHKLQEAMAEYGNKANRGILGQNVERFFFGYEPNCSPEADFKAAGIELKCTGLKENINRLGEKSLAIKERLVCDIINYMDIADVEFKDSPFYKKCLKMLILFYLYEKGVSNFDLRFIKMALWKLPSKDLLILKQDYETIVNKVRQGRAHEISESDTLYLAACRKGAGGDVDLRQQPNSDKMAYQRAFSLKPAYMRTILDYINSHGGQSATNFYEEGELPQLVSEQALLSKSFHEIIMDRFKPYYGLNYNEIVGRLKINPSKAKHKYALLANSILRLDSTSENSKIEEYEEFRKSGIVMKTVRVNYNQTINESMSFENIDYTEIFENAVWEDSRLYEILTTQFLFVIFRESEPNSRISILGNEEREYKLHKAFFWSMPKDDLDDARLYWENIREAVLSNHIVLDSFYCIADHKKFHVRPKGTKTSYKNAAINPNGGMADKYCYWFNSDYVKSIINENCE